MISEKVLDPDMLRFRAAAGIGVDHPLLRGAVGLQRRYDETAGAGRSFEEDARYISSLLANNSVLFAAVDTERPGDPPIASLVSTKVHGQSRVRRSIEVTGLVVNPDFDHEEELAGVLLAVACEGRNRFRPINANVNPEHEGTIEALTKMGFQKDEALSGIEIFVGIPPTDRYNVAAGQLALNRVGNLPSDAQDMLRQARHDLRQI